MSRLTLPHYGGKGHYMKCSESLACNGNCGDCDSLYEIVEKLARYEDEEERQPQTAADHFRAMNDEELADALMAYLVNSVENSDLADLRVEFEDGYRDALLRELRQPVKAGDRE